MTTAVSRRNFDKFVFLWCDYYGLVIETANVLYASDLVTGDDLLSLNGQQINALPVTLSQRCLLRGALLQVRDTFLPRTTIHHALNTHSINIVFVVWAVLRYVLTYTDGP